MQVASPGPVRAEPDASERVLPEAAARKRAAVELIRSHGPVLRSTARRYSICSDDADDAYQRGLEILLEKAPSTDMRQLVPWSRTVIKHEALAMRRTRERMLGRPAVAEVLEEDQDWVQMIPSDLDGPEERVAGREKVARSREALAKLKPQELRALTQLAEGYSYAEIGAMNNWTRTKVNRCLAEGRQRFRSVFRASEAGERCAEIAPLLSACCDGELDRARLAEVEDHLAACGGCRATLRTYRAAPKAAAALAPLVPASRGLWDRIQELAVGVHSKLTVADPTSGAAGSAGAARGALPVATAKIAAVCAGTAGTAAICVAAGVLPTPVITSKAERGPDRPPAHKVAERRPAPPEPMTVSEEAPEPVNAPDRSEPTAEPDRKPKEQERTPEPLPAPPPTPTEAEFTPEAAGTPVQPAAAPPPAPPPAPASSGGGGSGGVPLGGGGGEFGP